MIKSKKGKFVVYSKDGKRQLSKPYHTVKEAEKRLKQIEYFKNKRK